MLDKLNKSSLSGFNDKMIFSTSKEDKKIFLWDENTGTITYTYEDQNSKNFITKLEILGKDLYSEYVVSIQENKSLITFYKTNASEPFLKCNPIDERITCFEASEDAKLLFISTENGNFFVYEIFSGNLLASTQVSGERILEFKSVFKNNSGLLFVCEDYVKFYMLESILDRININAFYADVEMQDGECTGKSDVLGYSQTGMFTNSEAIALKEFPNTDKFVSAMIYGVPATHCFLFSKNKISVYTLPDLKFIKSMLCPPEEEIQRLEMNPKTYNSFFIFTKGKVYYMHFNDFFNDIPLSNSSSHKSQKNNLNSLKASFPDPILDSDIPITCMNLTNKNLLIGFEDGKIHVYSYADILNFNRLTPLKANLIFSNHKGALTNIVSANRPISQYGLNFNSKMEEVIVKALKKPSIPYTDIVPIKLELNTPNHFEQLLNENLDEKGFGFIENLNEEGTSNNNHFASGSGKSIKLNENIKTNAGNTANFDDPKFLKKKLAEVSEIMNKY